MKKLPLMLVCLILATCTLHIHAKKETVQKMYMFGLSASFKDSVVYITDIQEVKDVWYDTKTKFLLGRENYSSQLSQYLTEQKGQKNRTSIVMFNLDKKKLDKKLSTMKQLYTVKSKGKFDVRYLTATDFAFQTVELNFDDEDPKLIKAHRKEQLAAIKAAERQEKLAAKEAKREKKRQKKALKEQKKAQKELKKNAQKTK